MLHEPSDSPVSLPKRGTEEDISPLQLPPAVNALEQNEAHPSTPCNVQKSVSLRHPNLLCTVSWY